MEELLKQIEEAYDRFRALIASPEIGWEEALADGSSLRWNVEHVLYADSDAAHTLGTALGVEVAPVQEEWSVEDAALGLEEYDRMRSAIVTLLDQVEPAQLATSIDSLYLANVLGVLNSLHAHTNAHFIQVKGL